MPWLLLFVLVMMLPTAGVRVVGSTSTSTGSKEPWTACNIVDKAGVVATAVSAVALVVVGIVVGDGRGGPMPIP